MWVNTRRIHFHQMYILFADVDKDLFYIMLFSAPEQTHCTVVACDSKWVTSFSIACFWISTGVVNLHCCLVVIWVLLLKSSFEILGVWTERVSCVQRVSDQRISCSQDVWTQSLTCPHGVWTETVLKVQKVSEHKVSCVQRVSEQN